MHKKTKRSLLYGYITEDLDNLSLSRRDTGRRTESVSLRPKARKLTVVSRTRDGRPIMSNGEILEEDADDVYGSASSSYMSNAPGAPVTKFFSVPTSNKSINSIEDVIFELAKSKTPYWELLQTHYNIEPVEARKELCSLQMELRRELNHQLGEDHSNFAPAVQSAKSKGLISKEQAKIYSRINEAANEAKHESILSIAPL